MNTAGYRLTFGRVMRSELTKLHSLRSTWIVLGCAAVLTAALGAVIGWVASRERETGPSIAEAVGRAFLGVDLFSLVIGVFGVLLMTGEYGSGLIRATLAAVPSRLPVLWAKALVLVAVTAPLMLLVCLTRVSRSSARLAMAPKGVRWRGRSNPMWCSWTSGCR